MCKRLVVGIKLVALAASRASVRSMGWFVEREAEAAINDEIDAALRCVEYLRYCSTLLHFCRENAGVCVSELESEGQGRLTQSRQRGQRRRRTRLRWDLMRAERRDKTHNSC